MRLFVLVCALVLPTQLLGAETVGGKFGCLTKGWYEDFVKFAGANDLKSLQAYLDTKKCFQLKDGMRVTIIEYPGMFGGVWEVAYNGQKFFVQREGIRDY